MAFVQTPHGHRTDISSGVSSSLGERLQRYRKRLNISGEELASRINDEYGPHTISRPIIANIENNRRKVTKFDEIIQLAHGLRMTPLALICDLEQPLLPADMPVFLGIRNSSVAYRFLAVIGSPLPAPLERVEQVYSTYGDYIFSVKSLINGLNSFEDSLEEGWKADDSDSLSVKLFGPVSHEDNCKGLLNWVLQQRERLEAVGVVIPQSELDSYESASKRFFSISTKAREKHLITLEDEKNYKKWLSEEERKDKEESGGFGDSDEDF